MRIYFCKLYNEHLFDILIHTSHAHKSKSSDAALTDLLHFIHAVFLDEGSPFPKDIRGLKAITEQFLLPVKTSRKSLLNTFK